MTTWAREAAERGDSERVEIWLVGGKRRRLEESLQTKDRMDHLMRSSVTVEKS